ncbi:hypothetical protein [Mycetocola zhadangensis]|uniref:Lipoprotein n=1 Tax=Mycetocola zhadangensis TaxID=1164595 RepID=A0A3L7J3Z2_9MICO|nr:hypothetical protein [Mycetocola zhadangensis]RLQ85376.1 hypothetical protein D9V28_00310 [Mycetocola zhadangensis]GGE82059.1 hypothetical protein GCM10011313_00610 [Mycetocola zhadangensis]
MTGRTVVTRTVLLCLTALFASSMLAACSFGGTGRGSSEPARAEYSHVQAAEAVAQLPGITSAEIATSTDGLPSQVKLLAWVSAEAGYSANPAELLEYIIRQAWSSTDQRPTTTVRVELGIEGQDLDLVALAAEIGLPGTVDQNNKNDWSVRIPVDDVAAAYGAWPGEIPPPPASLGVSE